MEDISFELHVLEATRNNIIKIIDAHNIDQLNHIPSNFNNNLAWNFGHVVATQQLLIYGLSQTPMALEDELIQKYRKGSKPSDFINQEEINHLKDFSSKSIKQLLTDYEQNIFGQYKSYTTSYGTTLNNIDQAIRFNNVHEGLHFGTCLDLRKLV